MKHPAWRAAVAAAVFAAVVAPSLGVATAQTLATGDLPLVVRGDALTTTYAESLSFRLDAEATGPDAAPITGAILRYVVGDDGVRNRRAPDVAPGTRVRVAHDEDVLRGEIPPTAEIAWWWELVDARGRVAVTERRTARYLDEAFDWRSIDGDDVRVWYYGASRPSQDDRDRAAEAQSVTRQALADLEARIGAIPEERVELVLYRRQEDLRRAMLSRGEVYESRLATLGARVSRHVVILDWGSIEDGMGRDALSQVLYHELSHLVLNLRLGHEWLAAPTWLDEGLAMYAEGPLGGNEKTALDRALRRDELMSVRSLTSFPGDASRVTQAYGQSRDFVAFLIESGGEERFRRLLERYARGDRRFEDALREVYGFDQAGMYAAYRAARGLPPPAGGAPATQEDPS